MRASPGTGTAIAGDIQIGAVEIKDQDSSVRADVLDLTNNDALVTAIVDGDGTQVTDFMLGTDFSNVLGAASLVATDGSAALTLGLQVLGTDGTNAQILSTNTSGHLNIADGGNVISTDWNGTVPPIGAGTEAAALRVTVATDSTGVLSIDDNGGSLTVDGTFWQATQPVSATDLDIRDLTATDVVTANLSATDNAVLDNIDADTSNIQTAVELIDDAIVADDAAFTPATTKVMMAGFEFDDVTPDSVNEGDAGAARMSANRNIYTTIRDSAGNERGMNVDASGNAQVDIAASSATVTTTPAVAGGGTEATAQRVTIANDSTGVLSVDDNGGNLSVDWAGTVPPIGAGTEAAALRVTVATDSTGVLSVDDNGGALTVDGTVTANAGTGTFTVDSELPAAAALADAASATPTTPTIGAVPLLMNATTIDRARAVVNALDSAGTGITAVGIVGQLDDTSTGAVTENQFAPVRISSRRALLVEGVASGTVIPVSDGAGNLSVDWAGTVPPIGAGTEAAALRVTLATDSTGLVSVDDNGGNLSVDWAGTVPPIGAGTEAAALRVTLATDSTGVVSVDDNGGVLTVDGTITANAGTGTFVTSNAIVDGWDNAASDGASVSGDVAHDAADAGEPVKIGFKAETSLKGITLVADGDRTNGYADADGVQIVKIGTTGADKISERVANTDGASTAFTNFSAVASTYNYVESISIWNSSATNGYVDFRDGTAGSILWTMAAPTVGGSIMAVPGGIFKTSANTALAFDVSGALTTVYISVSGYQAKV